MHSDCGRGPDRRLVINTEDGVQLDADVWTVRGSRPRWLTKPVVAVLVHQWSKLGGCKAIMRGLAMHLAQKGFSVVTFDMRGVGHSTGRSTFTGKHEVKDVEAVCRWAINTFDQNVLLIGSSAGAPIAGSALDSHPRIRAYVGLGYVFGWWASWVFGSHYLPIMDSRKPKHFIQGSRDGFTSLKRLKAVVDDAEPPCSVFIFPDIGHFALETTEYDEPIAQRIVEWAETVAPLLCA